MICLPYQTLELLEDMLCFWLVWSLKHNPSAVVAWRLYTCAAYRVEALQQESNVVRLIDWVYEVLINSKA